MKMAQDALQWGLSLLRNRLGGMTRPVEDPFIASSESPRSIAGIPVDFDRSAELARYKKLRAAADRLLQRLCNSLPNEFLLEAARQLGRLRNGIVCVDDDGEWTAINEHGLFISARDGVSTVERFLDDASERKDANEVLWLQMLLKSWYSLFLIRRTEPGFGALIVDILSGQERLLVDVNLSLSGPEGHVFAGRMVPLGNCVATTGCGMLVSDDRTVNETRRYVERRFRGAVNWSELEPTRATEIETFILRNVLAGQNSQFTVASRPGDLSGLFERMQELNSLDAPPRERKKIGRNEPCPCGSGWKYKKCCGRGVR